MKQLLNPTRRFAALLLMMVSVLSARALDFRMTEITWTFDTVTTVTQADEVQNLGGIYYQGGAKSGLNALAQPASGTFSDGTTWTTSQPFVLVGNAFKDSYLEGKHRMAGAYNSSFARALAFNVTTPGTCYVVMKTTTAAGSGNFGLHFQYKGFEAKWTHTSATKPLSGELTELTLTAGSTGTFWIASAQTAEVYAVRFVPASDESGLVVKEAQQPAELKQLANGVWAADFGRDAFGQIELTLTGNEGDVVTVRLGECKTGSRINRTPGGSRRYKALTVTLHEGTHTYRPEIPADSRNTGADAVHIPMETGEVLPFRYVEVEGYGGTLAKEDVVRQFVHYRWNDDASNFHCSNDTLNRVWDLCKYSMKATSFAGIYVDGDRERIPYEADALINQLGHYANDCEFTLARRTFDWLMRNPTWPTEWSLQMVLIAWNDYLYSGDKALLEQWVDLLRPHTLEAFRNDETGLITTLAVEQTAERLLTVNRSTNLRDIVDWPHGGEDDGFEYTDYNAVVNAYHYETLKCMAKIYEALGRTAESEEMKAKSEAFAAAYNAAFLDTTEGIYRDGVGSAHSSLHANMFALCFGLVPDEYVESVTAFVVSRGMACSVYGSQFLLDALYNGGNGRAAFRLMTSTASRSWWNMIREGSTITMEAWGDAFKPNQDWNHAWGAAPANIIPFRLMGIRPTAPGFTRAEIRPQTALLKEAECHVPTIHGQIAATVSRTNESYTLSVNIPQGIAADVYLPLPATATYTLYIDDAEVQAVATERGFLLMAQGMTGNHVLRVTHPFVEDPVDEDVPTMGALMETVEYDFTDTSVWGAQTISDGTEHIYDATGQTATTGVSFLFESGGAAWDGGSVKISKAANTTNSINYIKVTVPASCSADITATAPNNSRRITAGFSLGAETVKITEADKTVTISNDGGSAADLYICAPYAPNGSVKKIRVYDPNALVKHTYSVNFVDSEGNIVREDAFYGSAEEDKDYTLALPKAFDDDDGYYWVLAGSQGKTDFSVTRHMGTTSEIVNYTYAKDPSIVYYLDLDGTVFPKASNGGASTVDDLYTDILPAGQYSVEIYINATLSSQTRDVSVYLGDISMGKFEDTGVKTVSLNLPAPSAVKISHDSGRSNYVDYILVRRTGELPTAINELPTDDHTWQVFYDLQGRKVRNPSKQGLYISREGKKIMIR